MVKANFSPNDIPSHYIQLVHLPSQVYQIGGFTINEDNFHIDQLKKIFPDDSVIETNKMTNEEILPSQNLLIST